MAAAVCLGHLDLVEPLGIGLQRVFRKNDQIGELASLEVGKLADLTVLSENPLKADPERLDEIEVIETYRSGHRFLWSQGADGAKGT